jgi:hypothetical protein
MPTTAPDLVDIDHRSLAAIGSGDLMAYVQAALKDARRHRIYIETVHRLTDLGAVTTHPGTATSREGFDAEWRLTGFFVVDGDLINRYEIFDEDDLDTALARFDELHPQPPRLENAATQAYECIQAHFAARDWDAMAEALADDVFRDDRRRVVGAELRKGRDAVIAEFSALAEIGVRQMTSDTIAIRGSRLVLSRSRASGRDPRADSFRTEVLSIAELDADQRTRALITFDPDDFDAAIAELDAHYLAGEAAPYSAVWSAVMQGYAALNRHERPLMTPDVASVDHRRGRAFTPGDLPAFIDATWDLMPQSSFYIDDVHRLNDIGVVVTHVVQGTTPEGFDAEWRQITVLKLAGDCVSHCEMFDEADLHAALARFNEFARPTRRLENTASRVGERYLAYFAAGDWDAMPKILADNFFNDDRRPVVGSGILVGRDAQKANERAIAELWTTTVTLTVVATRGNRLALARLGFSGRDEGPEAFLTEMLTIVEINADERIVASVSFGIDDFEAAIAELDARYLAGEAAGNVSTWSVITAGYAALNRHEVPPSTPDYVIIDHRLHATIGALDLGEDLRAAWDLTPNLKGYIEAVHQLSGLGAVVTYVDHGTSREGLDAEWRGVHVLTLDGDVGNRCEIFDEANLDAALARFEELQPQARRLENAASRVDKRFQACFAARAWDLMAKGLSDGFSIEDRRRVVNMGNSHGLDAELTVHAYAAVGTENVKSTVVATRAQRLALNHYRFSGRDQRPDSFRVEMLAVVEIDADERMAAVVVLDADDIDAAFKELETRYLAGEAAAHADTWSVITSNYAAFNRHELPAVDWDTVDHRRATPFASSTMTTSLRAIWDLTPDLKIHIEAVHRLSSFGAVITHTASGSSPEGFDAEWRAIDTVTVEGHRINRCEIFDEANLDAALARLEELQPQTRRPENAASQAVERYWKYFAAREWPALAETMADDICSQDRRRVVNGGELRGRAAHITNMRAVAEVGFEGLTSTVIASRGQRLTLIRIRSSMRGSEPGEVSAEMLSTIEIDTDNRITAAVIFCGDDFDAAIAELDARYVAGEGAAHSHTWLLVMQAQAAGNRHEFFPNTADWVNIDHRRGRAYEQGELKPFLRASWNVIPDAKLHTETVHRLTNAGAVSTVVATGTSQEGFDAEWREIALVTFDGDLLSRCELFDEADLDGALARFDELQPQAPRLENAASQVYERFQAHFATSDWDVIADMLTADLYSDDRRPVVGGGIRPGRDALIEDLRAVTDVAITNATSDAIATRGERLALARARYSRGHGEPNPFHVDFLQLVEIDTEGRITAFIAFDPDDVDAAFEELDARYVAGEAASHGHTWSVIAGFNAAFNRQEIPPTDWVTVDHRRLVTADTSDLPALIRDVWGLTPDLSIHIEAVHQLSGFGAVVTRELHGTSREGFEAEWRMIQLLTVEGGRISRSVLFDETDLDAALARFEELQRQTRLENAAARAEDRYFAYYKAHDWAAIAEILAGGTYIENRVRVVNTGLWEGRDVVIAKLQALAEAVANSTSTVVAIRGERLALTRVRYPNSDGRYGEFVTEQFIIAEIDTDKRIAAQIVIDPDDFDAAVAELDARYLAGEAAGHADAWSLIMQAYTAVNRHEMPPTAPGWVNIDHRRGRAFAPGDLEAYLHATWDLAPDVNVYVEAVHRLSNRGGLVTHCARGSSQEGFDAESREVILLTFEADMVNHFEVFDEADLDAAIARFEELQSQPQAPRLENSASATHARLTACVAAHDWNALSEILADDIAIDDRRRVVNSGITYGRDAAIANMGGVIDVGLTNVSSTVLATRGDRLDLCRTCISGQDRPEAFQIEFFSVVEIDADERIVARVLFDPDDIDAAFAELDGRYLAGEAAAYSPVWTFITNAYATLNRHELPPKTSDWATVDHRARTTFAGDGLSAYLRAGWDLTPDIKMYIEAVPRISDAGAVLIHSAYGSSREGFDAEWRMILLLTIAGGLVKHGELFDEVDLDAALARFEELDQPAS